MSKPTLRTRRKLLDLTLGQMAEIIDEPGCDAPFLSRLERNLHRSEWIDPKILEKIGKAYKVRLRVKAKVQS